jgi:ATP-dependent protease ClpP protease subunit
VITPNPDYTPNPERGIYIQGVIDQEMVYRVTPQIISLQHESRDPITVYIDSPGGLVDYKDAIFTALRAPTQADLEPCKVITVVLSMAASAAADLTSAGYYALAHPDSMVMYHGVRVPPDRPLTAEETFRLAHRLRAGNESFAAQLARWSERRFLFRFISHYKLLDGIREKAGKPLSDLSSFLTLIAERVSSSADQVLDRAYARYARYSSLLESAIKRWNKGKGRDKSYVQLEVDQLNAIIEFEVKQNKKNKEWRFETEGIQRLTEDFFLLNEYLAFIRSERFKDLVFTFGHFVLTTDEQATIEKLATQKEKDETLLKIVSPRLRPVWSFFVAMCHVLQQGDNHLTAKDAFWLGLIDEVIGEDLPSFRVFSEHAQEVAKREKDEETKASGEETAEAADAAAGA